MARTTQGPHREEIKAIIRMRGITLERLSLQLGYKPRAVGMALSQPWPRLQRKIAAFLGTSVFALWPQWYASDGTCTALRRPRHGADASRRAGRRNVYRSEAA